MSKIEIKGLTKVYGNTKALDDITMTIQPDKIYGLLGRNGAGKTTMLNILTNKLFPTKGSITVDGESVIENDKVLSSMFYMMEKTLYPQGLKVKEVFQWTKEFYPFFDMTYAESLSEKFDLTINKKVKELSTGYTSIFKVITALASNAKIIILDEPVLGLDANHRDILYKEILGNYIRKPKTIIISTHLIEEVADVLEEVIILKKGSMILKDSVENILASAYTVSGEASKVDEYKKGRNYIGEETMGRFKSVTILETSRDYTLGRALDIEFTKPAFQKLFISLTN